MDLIDCIGSMPEDPFVSWAMLSILVCACPVFLRSKVPPPVPDTVKMRCEKGKTSTQLRSSRARSRSISLIVRSSTPVSERWARDQARSSSIRMSVWNHSSSRFRRSRKFSGVNLSSIIGLRMPPEALLMSYKSQQSVKPANPPGNPHLLEFI